MSTIKIEWIVPDGNDLDRRIDAIGWGEDSYDKLDDAIHYIENETKEYWTSVDGVSVWIIVAKRRSGRKYLKTENDGYEPNNLLSLPKKHWAK